MADKRYLDLTGLSQYDAKIKALIDSKDAVVLASAKEYANGLSGDYDVKGAAAQALTDAKAYTDTEVAKIQALTEAEIDAAIAEVTANA